MLTEILFQAGLTLIKIIPSFQTVKHETIFMWLSEGYLFIDILIISLAFLFDLDVIDYQSRKMCWILLKE
jgi:hypothetical protein